MLTCVMQVELRYCCRSQHEEIDLISEQEMYDSAPKTISKPVCWYCVD